MKPLYLSAIIGLLFSSCAPQVLRRIPPQQLQHLELKAENTQGLNPGMEIKLRATATLTNGKVYSTHPNGPNQRLLLWDDLLVQSNQGQFLYGSQKFLVNDGLVYQGKPDTVEIFLKSGSYPNLITSSHIIVDYNSHFYFNANGRNGGHGYHGSDGADTPVEHDYRGEGGHGGNGGNGSRGSDVVAIITDTIIHGKHLFIAQFESSFKKRKTMLFADKSIRITANGGNGGNGGTGGDGGQRPDKGMYQGGNGGHAGHGASGGDITIYVSPYVYVHQSQLILESHIGKSGRAGESGDGFQSTHGIAGFIADGILFPKKEGRKGTSGFNPGKIEIIRQDNPLQSF